MELESVSKEMDSYRRVLPEKLKRWCRTFLISHHGEYEFRSPEAADDSRALAVFIHTFITIWLTWNLLKRGAVRQAALGMIPASRIWSAYSGEGTSGNAKFLAPLPSSP